MQAGKQPKLLDCPLSAEGRAKKGTGTRLEEIVRDTMQTLVADAGFLQYPCPVYLILLDCPAKVLYSFGRFLI